MKAWIIKKSLESFQEDQMPSVSLTLENVPKPNIVNKNEVLVKMKATSINFNTVWSCLRKPKDPFALLADHIKRNPKDKHHDLNYYIPGSDGVGIVEKVGESVTNVKSGDEVIIHCAVIADKDLYLRDNMLAKSQSIWGYETNFGSFAEYTLVKDSQLIKKPITLDSIIAGSCLLTLGTAYRMLISQNGAQIKAGETCLIWGASGGLGVFAIQLCLAVGAIPVCIVSDESKANYCKKFGAEKIIICNKEEQSNYINGAGKPVYANWRKFEKKIKTEIGKDRVDCVFEHVGNNVLQLSIYMLARGGRLVTCAATSGYETIVDIRFIWMEMKRIIGSHFCNTQEANEAIKMLTSGFVRHECETIINFNDIPLGIDLLYNRKSKGKIVVTF
jgi:crotonyl-CoA reductase